MPSTRTLAAAVIVAATALAGCAHTESDRTAGRFFDDGSVTMRAKAALVKDDAGLARDINVQTYRGVVQLSGFADSREQAQRAEQAVRDVAGVAQVLNDIRVKPQRGERFQ
jgi:hyperosmotically inducible protein